MASMAQSMASANASQASDSASIQGSASGSASVAAADMENFQKFQNAYAAVKKAYGMKASGVQNLPSDALLLDSGATWHITGKDAKKALSQPRVVTTVQGDVEVTEGGSIANSQLQLRSTDAAKTEAIPAPGGPEVGALGKLIKDYRLFFT